MPKCICSFCGKPNTSVDHLIVKDDTLAICNECVDICVHTINSEKADINLNTIIDLDTEGDLPNI